MHAENNTSSPTKIDRLLIDVADTDHALGPPDAPLTLVEYGDYECPDCFNAQPIVAELRKRLGDRLRVVFRHFPRSSVHPRASAAAAAAEAAAAQGQFWKMHEALFAHQKELSTLDLTHLALNLGLEIYRFNQAIDSDSILRRISNDFDGAVRNQIAGTPTFFINGCRYRGPRALEPMLAALNDSLKNPAKPC
jgi:protein-disulfide isomerase